jgi:hypothetical protein
VISLPSAIFPYSAVRWWGGRAVTELRTHEQGILLFLGLGVLVCRALLRRILRLKCAGFRAAMSFPPRDFQTPQEKME